MAYSYAIRNIFSTDMCSIGSLLCSVPAHTMNHPYLMLSTYRFSRRSFSRSLTAYLSSDLHKDNDQAHEYTLSYINS